MQGDDIIGCNFWNPPYSFLVMKHSIWDATENEILQVVFDPAQAYAYWLYYIDSAKNTIKNYTYRYVLVDPWHKDALGFCKSKYEEVKYTKNKSTSYR